MVGVSEPRVLVVDDLETNRSLFYRRLSRKGYVPELAVGGEQALEMIGQRQYDLVLLDIMMPGLDGIDVLKLIRAKHDAADLPVIMVTARNESEGIVTALDLGANDYVTKPVDMPVLLARINTQLQRRQAEIDVRKAKTDVEKRFNERAQELTQLSRHLTEEAQKRESLETSLRLTSEQAKTVSVSKTRFMSNMSHELRTPLNAIIGFCELIRTELDRRKDDTKCSEYAEYIGESGQRLLSLIDQVTALSDIEAGRIIICEEMISAAEIIDNAVRVMSTEAVTKGIELRRAFATPDAVLYGDSGHIEWALVNVIANAIKFSDDGGRVDICMERSRGGDLVISVADQGAGMTPEQMAVALEPFGRTPDPLTRRDDALGLGLPLAKSLMELHGGWVEIDSEPSIGSTISLVVPRSRVATIKH